MIKTNDFLDKLYFFWLWLHNTTSPSVKQSGGPNSAHSSTKCSERKEQRSTAEVSLTIAPLTSKGEYINHSEPGVYKCAGCGVILYDSADKLETHGGWPDFSQGTEYVVCRAPDYEIKCGNCGCHLGHIFQHTKSKTNERH